MYRRRKAEWRMSDTQEVHFNFAVMYFFPFIYIYILKGYIYFTKLNWVLLQFYLSFDEFL